jgi:hypothetical protein
LINIILSGLSNQGGYNGQGLSNKWENTKFLHGKLKKRDGFEYQGIAGTTILKYSVEKQR